MRGKVILVGVVVAIFAIMAILSVDDGSKEVGGVEEVSTNRETSNSKGLKLIDDEAGSDGYNVFVTGTIKNNSSKNYSYVQVEINTYDKNGAQVGSTLDNINNLEAGGTWRFKAMIFEDNVASYKIKDITAY